MRLLVREAEIRRRVSTTSRFASIATKWLYAIAALLSIASTQAFAAPTLVGFKMVEQGNQMLHFDLDAADASASMFTLTEPDRLVIDIDKATLGTELPSRSFETGVVKAIRYAQHGEEYLRVVLDLRQAVTPTSKMVQRQDGQRLVVDLGVKASTPLPDQVRTKVYEPPRNVVIAIDAGHGGKDPGAIGRRKTHEKDVVLAIAIRVHNQLVGVAGVTPVLVRKDDVYIDLRKRMDIARQANADIFVSIHADAINREAAHGSSVYALSLDGASSEAAAWLAKSETQSAALHGDVSLTGLEDGLAKTLLNLTQGNTMERSIELGGDVLQELKAIGPVHKKAVEQAAFAVLKSPDIPSILVETAFISNLEEEKKLNSEQYQEKLALAIAQGVYNYLLRRAPEGTYLAEQRTGQSEGQ